jgi:acetate kinase
MKYILTINPGSTAVKYVLFDVDGAVVERRDFRRGDGPVVQEREREWLSGLTGVDKIAIRIVHGGTSVGPLEVDETLRAKIQEYTRFAPIHNNLALNTLDIVQGIFTAVPIIASFDTDFHKTMPNFTATYPINQKLARELAIKRYGFHGLAVESVLLQLQEQKNGLLPEKIICAHLGGGCSITAVSNGSSVDTTMGLTPLEGIMMVTRSGTVGAGIVEYISEAKGWTVAEVVAFLNNESGFSGLTGSKNTIDIIERASKQHQPEKLAVDIFVHQIVKQIFAYYGTLQGCDALVFSGGIGYGNMYIRNRILEKLALIGITEQHMFVCKADEAMVLFENCKKL